MNASPITKITSWLKFLGKNLHLAGCATFCAKSEVMLEYVYCTLNHIAIDMIYFRNLGSRFSQPFLVGLNAFVFKAQKRLFCTFVETNGKRGFGRHAQNSVKFTEAVTSYQTSQAAILTYRKCNKIMLWLFFYILL